MLCEVVLAGFPKKRHVYTLRLHLNSRSNRALPYTTPPRGGPGAPVRNNAEHVEYSKPNHLGESLSRNLTEKLPMKAAVDRREIGISCCFLYSYRKYANIRRPRINMFLAS